MTQPRFKHDCTDPKCCQFVGQTLRCDVYLVSKSAFGEAGLVMRRGNDGDDYSSFPKLSYVRLMAAEDAEAFHALQMAEEFLAKSS